MKYTCVMFDLDGTLLDTITDLATSANMVLKRMSLPQHPVAAYKQFVGDGIGMLTYRALPESMRDNATLTRCTDAIRDEYALHCMNATSVYDGIHELLAKLTRHGHKVTVLSNKPDSLTKLLVAHFFPAILFSGVNGARDTVPRKPDPSAALEILASLGIKPDKCIYLGDSKTDMLTAVAAGMFPVGALWGFREAEELLDNGACALIEHPADLLRLMQKSG